MAVPTPVKIKNELEIILGRNEASFVEIMPQFDEERYLGVQMRYRATSIISTENSAGGKDGLYEVSPTINGRNMQDLFGPKAPDVIGPVALETAIKLANAAYKGIPALRTTLHGLGYSF